MRISVRLDPEHAAKLQDLARRTDQRTTEIVKRAIDLYHEHEMAPSERPYDILMRTGFIGGAEGEPDFSTNYKKYVHEYLDRKYADR